MQHSPSWEANLFRSYSRNFPHLRKPKVHYRTHERPPSHLWVFQNSLFSRGGVVSASPNPQAGDHPLSAVRDCLFNLFAATLHIGGRSSIRKLRTRHAVVTETHKHGNRYTYYLKLTSVTFTFISYSVLHSREGVVRLLKNATDSTMIQGPNPGMGKSFPLLRNVEMGPETPRASYSMDTGILPRG